jgi:hypothetical protein
MSTSETFTVAVTTEVTITRGWAAWFMPLYDDDDTIATVEAGVAEVTESTVRVLPSGVPCVQPEGESWWLPCAASDWATDELAHDDTHDLRNRIFPTRAAAEEHVRAVLDRWEHPQPWESFVRV